jgi:hypothetical protein
MIALLGAAFCYGVFFLFETFALALDRLSPIKVRGLLEEHPERARILAGPGEVEVVRVTTKVLVQILLLVGLLTVVSACAAFGIQPAWAWGGATFLAGWLATEVLLLRLGAASDPEKTVARLLPLITAGSWLLLPLAFLIRKFSDENEPARAAPRATEEEVQAFSELLLLHEVPPYFIQYILNFGLH